MSAGHCWCLGGRSIAFVLFTLMQRPLSVSQVPRRVAASDRQAARVVGVFPLQYINMSSAKSTDLMVFVAERTSGTFLVYSKNRSGSVKASLPMSWYQVFIRYLLHYSLWMSCACVRLQLEATVKLGYSVLGLARTLGYNVLSVDHETSPIGKHVHFFRIRRTERGTKSDITYQLSLQEHFFALSLALFLIKSMSSTAFLFWFQLPGTFSSSRCPERRFHRTKKRVMNDIQNGEASSVAESFAWTRGTGHSSEQNRVLDSTYFGYYVPFFISLEGT